jgi:hypothetical protein
MYSGGAAPAKPAPAPPLVEDEEEKKTFFSPHVESAPVPDEAPATPPKPAPAPSLVEDEEEEETFFPPIVESAPVPTFVPDAAPAAASPPSPPPRRHVVEERFEPTSQPPLDDDRRDALFRTMVDGLNYTPSEAQEALVNLPAHISDDLNIYKVRVITLVWNRDQFAGLSNMYEWTIMDKQRRYFFGQLKPGDRHSPEDTRRCMGLVVDASRWGKLFLAKPEDVLYQMWGNRFDVLKENPMLLPHIIVLGAPFAIDKKQTLRVFERHIYMVRNLTQAQKILGQLVGGLRGGLSREEFVRDMYEAHRPCIGCALPLTGSIPFYVCSEGHDVCMVCYQKAGDTECPCEVFVGVGLDKKVQCRGHFGESEAQIAAQPTPLPFNEQAVVGDIDDAAGAVQPMEVEQEWRPDEEVEEEDSGEVFFNFGAPEQQEEIMVQCERCQEWRTVPAECVEDKEASWFCSMAREALPNGCSKGSRSGKKPKQLRPGKREPECKHRCADKYNCDHVCCKGHFDAEVKAVALQELEDRALAKQLSAKRKTRGRSREKKDCREPEVVASPPRGRTRRRKKAKRARSRSRSVTPPMSPRAPVQGAPEAMEDDNPYNVPPLMDGVFDPMKTLQLDLSAENLYGLFGSQVSQLKVGDKGSLVEPPTADQLMPLPFEWDY